MSQHISFTIRQSSLGSILVGLSESGICAISLGSDPDSLVADLHDRFPKATLTRGDTAIEKLAGEVAAAVESPRRQLRLPLDIGGTPFQQRVWQALREIPPGTTATYTNIAARLGAPASVRAVARACGANPIAVAIPCHRVVGRDGRLSGYRWGVERKRELLFRESRA
jgi:AraC family transcriptional regulator of adaptative response/methylated-DNA-[protein]-cysteine methyltransferase